MSLNIACFKLVSTESVIFQCGLDWDRAEGPGHLVCRLAGRELLPSILPQHSKAVLRRLEVRP